MAYPEVRPGDIVLCYRRKYDGPFKYLVTRAILFFTTAWWLREPTSKVSHAELAVTQLTKDEFKVATMEPPRYRYKTRSYKRKVIFRVKMLDTNYVEKRCRLWVINHLGMKYDFLRIALMVLNWLFRTSWFTDHYKNGARDICSESVADFCDSMLFYPCSPLKPRSTTPDDIYDFCLEHPELFRLVYDDRA